MFESEDAPATGLGQRPLIEWATEPSRLLVTAPAGLLVTVPAAENQQTMFEYDGAQSRRSQPLFVLSLGQPLYSISFPAGHISGIFFGCIRCLVHEGSFMQVTSEGREGGDDNGIWRNYSHQTVDPCGVLVFGMGLRA